MRFSIILTYLYLITFHLRCKSDTNISLFTIRCLFKNFSYFTHLIIHHRSYYKKKWPVFTSLFCIRHRFSGSTLSQCEALPEHFWASCTSVRLCPHLRHILTFWLCVLSHICVFAAHPDSPEAALSAGGRAGGVPFGSQTVHGVCLRPDWMSTVSLYFKSNNNPCILSIFIRRDTKIFSFALFEHRSIYCFQNICLKMNKKLKCLFITRLDDKSLWDYELILVLASDHNTFDL